MKKAILILVTLMMATMIATSVTAATVTISGPAQVWDSPLRGDWTNANIGQNGGDRQWRLLTGASGRHNLMKFDLSGIPVGATINSAVMGIYIRRYGNPGDTTGYQISRLQEGMSWVEGTNAYADPAFAGDVTWNSRVQGSALWQVAGATGAADIDLNTSISWDFAGNAAEGFVNFNLKGFVQDWVSNSWENNGILFWGGSGGDDGNNYNWAYLSEASGTTEMTRVPYLMVDYTPAVVTPEPSSLAALGMFGLGALGFIKRRSA